MNCSIPITVDGSSYRKVTAVNGRIPGPTLIVKENQVVIVDVNNYLTNEGVTIHWHGMHQRNSPWMDGVASVSQAPIAPGGSFRYIFRAKPSGTHWYHSHLGAQRTDGLFGALIVREDDNIRQDIMADLHEDIGEVIDRPEEHTMTLVDWQREASTDLFVKIHSSLKFYPDQAIGTVPTTENMPYLRTLSRDLIEVGPVPYWSGLINGKGRYIPQSLWPINSVLSIFNVNPGKNYRFRLIGAQSLYAYRFEVQDHRLLIIATDGNIVHVGALNYVDYIIVHSGERYDFILQTKERSEIEDGNFWIRAETLEKFTSDNEVIATNLHTAEAILHYEPSTDPNLFTYDNVLDRQRQCSQQNKCTALNCPFKNFPINDGISCNVISGLRNRFNNELPSIDIDVTDTNRIKFFNFGFEGQSSTSAINGRNFRPPASPYQTYRSEYNDDINNMKTCQQCDLMTTKDTQPRQCTCTYVESILKNADVSDESVMMVFSAVGVDRNREFSHPVHLHGHSFYVVHIGYGTYDENGVLMESTTDVECDTPLCMNPSWRNGTMPSDISKLMSGTTGKLINTAVLKDTVIVPAGGYVAIAFIADNPGYWFLHCHIEVHQLEGMALIIQEYDESKHNYNLPEGINKPGKFYWTYENFNTLVGGGQVAKQFCLTYLFTIVILVLMLC